MTDGLCFKTEDGSEVITVVELAHQEAVCQQLSQHPVVIIDTEGPNAEVISLLAPAKDGNYIYLLHNLAISRNLQKLLVNHNVLKVGWGLDNDIRILEGRCGRTMRPVLDVQSMVIPFMGFTNLDAAANRCLDESKPYGKRFAGAVNWLVPFISPDDERVRYCTKDVELIFKLWEHHNSHDVKASMPDTLQMLNPKDSYRQFLPVDLNQFQTFEAAVNAVVCSDLLQETNKETCHSTAASLVSMYWSPRVDQAVMDYVNWLLENAAADMNRYNSVEALSNYIFYTAWSSQQAPTVRPDRQAHDLYINPDTAVVQYLVRHYSQRDTTFYPYSLPCQISEDYSDGYQDGNEYYNRGNQNCVSEDDSDYYY